MTHVFQERLNLDTLTSDQKQSVLNLLEAAEAVGCASESCGPVSEWPKTQRKYLKELAALKKDWRSRINKTLI